MSETLDTMLAAMPAGYQKTVGFPTYDILAAASIPMEELEQELGKTRRMLDPAFLTGADLDSYIRSRSGLVRNAATYASGVLQVTGTGTIMTGDLFESGGGIQFAAIETVAIRDRGQVSVRCTQAGAIGNLPAGSITLMPVQIAGIVTVSNSDTMTGGYDAETDGAYFDRYLLRLQTPPTSGNQYHYRSWALEVSGVGGVQVYPLGHGPNTVDVVIIDVDGKPANTELVDRVQAHIDPGSQGGVGGVQVYPLGHGPNTVDVVIIDVDGKPANTELVDRVQAHIDPGSQGLGKGEAPIGAYCYVSGAAGISVALALTVTALPGAVQSEVTEAIKQAVAAYLKSVAFRQDYVSYAQIAAAILNATGVEDFADLKVNNGTSNVAIAARQVAVLGTVTVNYANRA